MAAALFRAILVESGIDASAWRIESAGTWGAEGRPAAPEVIDLLAARGLNVAAHRSRMVSEKLLRNFHLVLTMEPGHKEALEVEFPFLREKVYTLAELAGENGAVDDPMGGPPESFVQTAQEIDHILRLGLPAILQKVNYETIKRR